jgi:hypothetical protein
MNYFTSNLALETPFTIVVACIWRDVVVCNYTFAERGILFSSQAL